MCVIIAKNAGVKALDEKYFKEAWKHNGDGAGIVWKDKDGEVMVQKGFMKEEDFLAKIKEINKDDTSYIVHCRIKSVGEVKPENCHPFIMDRVTFAHNGTLGIQPFEGKTDSETFGLAILKTRSMKWIKENQLLLELALGSSKFAIMDNKTGEIFILNKEKGSERDDAWFSNSSAFPTASITTLPTYKGYSSYSHYYDDYDDDFWDRGYTNTGKFPADKTFGTKRYQPQYGKFDKTKRFWVYSSTNEPMYVGFLSRNFVRSRKGFIMLRNDIKPDDNLPTQVYCGREDIFSVINDYQEILNNMLKDYQKNTYDYTSDRQEDEQNMGALYCLLNAVRRLIHHQKVVDFDSIMNFLIANSDIKPDSYSSAKTFMENVNDYALEFLQETGDATALSFM